MANTRRSSSLCDKGFYKDEGLDVEILEGSGSTTVAQLVANQTNPVAYVDAATMMRGVSAGMPIKAVGVTLQQSPMSFIYRADSPRPTKIEEIKGSRIAITAGDASLAIFTAFLGKLNMQLSDVQLITVANPQSKEQAVLSKQADSLARLLHGSGPAHAAPDRREDGLDTALRHGRHHDALAARSSSTTTGSRKPRTRISSSASCAHRNAAGTTPTRTVMKPPTIFIKHAKAFNMEIALLEIDGTMTIIRTKHTQGKPLFWSAKEDWQESQDLLEKFAKMPPQAGPDQILHQRVSGRAAVYGEEVSDLSSGPARR